MKKLQAMPQKTFMKLFFGFITVCFLIGAICVKDRADMFSGLWRIISGPSKISTNYFAVGGFAATFLNMALVAGIATALYCLPGAVINPGSTLAFLLTLGFGSWGINILNIWPSFLGVVLYCFVKKEDISAHVNTLLFSTGIAPLITELMIRYPGEQLGFTIPGVLLALVVGLGIGFLLPAGLAHSPKVHKGFDLYSAALPIGMMAFFLQAMLYKTQGVALPAAPAAETLQVASRAICAIFCGLVFGTMVVVAYFMGCKPKDYWQILRDPAQVTDIQGTYGNAGFLMNAGVYGLCILAYYSLVGATFNGITFGIIFCMLACCNSGSHPGNVWPIMVGYVISSLAFWGISMLTGGDFAGMVNAQAIVVGLCYANGLSPIADKYGWGFGILAGSMHYILVTSVPTLHGGYCLYNGGFTAALICLILVPELERFGRTKEERKLRKASKNA
ncbi:MAG: DUF1576 domain-containing protein [Oscillospiraceae bacterium]|nr:DUF1576 domain-containing protein [Oscillospiraceae bacterium]